MASRCCYAVKKRRLDHAGGGLHGGQPCVDGRTADEAGRDGHHAGHVRLRLHVDPQGEGTGRGRCRGAHAADSRARLAEPHRNGGLHGPPVVSVSGTVVFRESGYPEVRTPLSVQCCQVQCCQVPIFMLRHSMRSSHPGQKFNCMQLTHYQFQLQEWLAVARADLQRRGRGQLGDFQPTFGQHAARKLWQHRYGSCPRQSLGYSKIEGRQAHCSGYLLQLQACTSTTQR